MSADTVKQAVLNKASQDKFLLIFDLPVALRQFNTKFQIDANKVARDSVQFSVFGSLVPETEVPALTLAYAGQSLKVSSHGRTPPEPINVGFKIDNRFENWWTIWKWLDLLNDAKLSYYDRKNDGDHALNYMRNYQTDLVLIALDEYNKQIMQFTFTKAFPTILQGITYDYKVPDEIMSGFTFEFSQMLPKPLLQF